MSTDKSGIRVFRLFLAPNPVPPQTFKIVDISTRRYPPGFLKGLRHQHGKTGVAIENTVFPGSEGDYIAFHGHAVIRQADTKLLAISTMLAGQFVYTPFYGLPRWSQGLGRDAARVNDCRLYCTNNEQRLGARLTADRAAQAELETTRPLSPDLTMLWNPASLFVTMTCPPPFPAIKRGSSAPRERGIR
jgi:hypothetical protein